MLRNLKKKLLTVQILSFLIAAIGSVLLPQTRAVTVSDIVVDIDVPYGECHHVQTDSDGNIYYGNDLDSVYKSTDWEHTICTK